MFSRNTHSAIRNDVQVKEAGTIRVIVKALRLIETLAQADRSVRLGELAQSVGQPKTTVFRILATLRQQGYVQQAAGTDAYELTDRIALLTRNQTERLVRQVARPFLGRLLARFEQTVNLAVLDSNQVRYIEILEGLRSIHANPTVDTFAPVHCTALGKAILAFLSPVETRRILNASAPLQKYTDRTITSIQVLTRELGRIRKQGFAVDNEENEAWARCIAAPILGANAKPVAAISISGSVSALRGKVIRQVAQALKQCTRSISSQLGYIS